MKLGITGHQDLPAEAEGLLQDRIRALALATPFLTVLSSLARGADSIASQEVLAAGGHLHAVIPSPQYRDTFDHEFRPCFDRLLARASAETVLDYAVPNEEAYFAAGKFVARSCELLLAVWDGQPSRGLGGTADVVTYARDLGRNVEIIWPPGISR